MEDVQDAIQAEVAKQLRRTPDANVYQVIASLYQSKNETVARTLARTVSADEEAEYIGLVMKMVRDGGLVCISRGGTESSN